MTNHERFAEITGESDTVEIESLKMLLARIYEDVTNGIFCDNYDKYLKIYKTQIEWLNSEVQDD